jgi:hypothetical protein
MTDASCNTYPYTDDTLKASIGQFGDIHIDAGDSAGGITAMTCLSSLPKGSHPGFFFLPDIGCYFELDFLVTAVFCGLHHHGGTPPLLPTDLDLNDDKGDNDSDADSQPDLSTIPDLIEVDVEEDKDEEVAHCTIDSAYRLMLIAYPPTTVVDGGSRIAFGALPMKKDGKKGGKKSGTKDGTKDGKRDNRFDLGVEMTGFSFVNSTMCLV